MQESKLVESGRLSEETGDVFGWVLSVDDGCDVTQGCGVGKVDGATGTILKDRAHTVAVVISCRFD